MRGGAVLRGCSVDCGSVATEAISEETRNPANGRHADASQVVNLAVGETLLEQLNDLPAINQRLQLGRSTQIAKKIAALGGCLEAYHRAKQGILGCSLLALRVLSVRFHFAPA